MRWLTSNRNSYNSRYPIARPNQLVQDSRFPEEMRYKRARANAEAWPAPADECDGWYWEKKALLGKPPDLIPY